MEENKKGFPMPFWTANLTELFERSAYYAVASFLVIYLGQLGLGEYWPSILSSTVLWGLIYFLPILSGTIADQVGFKRALLVAFVLMAIGYFLNGTPVWFGFTTLSQTIEPEVTVSAGIVLTVVLGVLLIGIGGSVIKPCVSGTVQKTASNRATLAFAIFYMTINIGSLLGRFISWAIRTKFDLSYIFAVGTAFCIISFLVVLFLYSDPDDLAKKHARLQAAAEGKPKKSVGRILLDMVVVLKNLRFSLFLVVSTGFWFLYNQVYNIVPLYWKKVLETDPAVDIYTTANPFVIVFFQLLITRLFGKLKPVRSIIIGNIIVGLSMLINLIPIYLVRDIRLDTDILFAILPIGSVMGIATVGLIAFGELFTAPRSYEYIGALAPRGKEGLFLGYANLPIAMGAIISGFGGAAIFNEIMCHNSTQLPNGLLELDPTWNAIGWIILMVIGFASALGMWLFNRWLSKQVD
ncbi:MAG: MFS transporter [Acidobacteria bacterium]|nr:MFS transporter [Acidobacteriota bacterium]